MMAVKLELKSKVRALTSWFRRCLHFSETGDHDHQHEPLLDTVEAGVTHATQLGIAVGSPAESPGVENDGFPGQAESKVTGKPSRRKALLIGVCDVQTTSGLHNNGKKAETTVPDEPTSPTSARSETFSVSTAGSDEASSELSGEEDDEDEEDWADPPKLNGPHIDVEVTKKLLIGAHEYPLLIVIDINPSPEVYRYKVEDITIMIDSNDPNQDPRLRPTHDNIVRDSYDTL